MSNLSLSRDSTTIQLIEASQLLISESVNTIIKIDLDELENAQISKLAKQTLKQIDATYHTIDVLKPIPNLMIAEAIVRLESTIDELFVALNSHYSVLQERIMLMKCAPSDLIAYAGFCYELSLKLLQRAASIAPPQQSSNYLQEDEELKKYI